MKYPNEVSTDLDKLEFCYIAQEKLRLEHNAKGADFRDGKISKQEWDNYLSARFEKKQRSITTDIGLLKDTLKKSQRFDPDLENIDGS